MKNIIAILFFISVLFLNVQNVMADSPLFSGIESLEGAKKVNSHVVPVKPLQSKSCHAWNQNGWIVELEYYTQSESDGNTTPLEVAYTDYIEDLNHYYTMYPDTCEIVPEENPSN
jgi:hypothetical protein